MPIDASIYALQKPLPPPINPMEVAGQAMTLRNQQQAGRIAEERLKQEEQQTAEGELRRRDDELQAAAWQQAGGDPKKHVALFGQSGARPQAVQSLQKHYLDLEKGTAELDDKRLNTSKYHNEQFLGAVTQAKALPDDQYAAAWPTIKALAQKAHPDVQLSDAPPPKDQLWQLEFGLVTEKTLLDREAERRAAAKAQQEATAAGNADAAAKQTLAEKYRQQDAAALALAAEQQGPEGLAAAIAQLPPERRKPFLGVKAASKPDDIRRMGMSAEQAFNADIQRERMKKEREPVPGRDIPLPPAVEAQRVRMNANRAQLNGLSPQQLAQVNSLAKKLDDHPTVKDYNAQVNKLDSVSRILEGVSGPRDLAVVFEFMKGLDPSSVVRESEYDTAAKSGNLFAGWAAKFNGYLKPEGGFLPPNVKSEFQKILQQKLAASQRQVKAIHGDFARRIDKITGQQGTGSDYLTDYSTLYGDQGGGAQPAPASVEKWDFDAKGNLVRK